MTKNPLQTLAKGLGVGLVALLLAACSGDSTMKALLEQVPENADYVVVGNSKNVIESLGGSIEDKSKIVLPKNITDALPSDAENGLEEANDKLKDMGVDISGVAVFGDFESGRPTIVVSIDDEDKFTKYVKDEYDGENYEDEDNDFTLYSTGDEGGRHIAVHKGYAYIFSYYEENKDARRTARKLLTSIDEDGDFASSNFADYIIDSNVFGAAVKMPKELRDEAKQAGFPSEVANLYSGAVLMRGAVDGDEMTIDVKLVDKEGNDVDADKLKDLYDINARISSDALAYMGSNEQVVLAGALKNFKWDKYIDPILNSNYVGRDEAAAISVVKGFLNKIDGTIAVGFGVNKGLESLAAIEADESQTPNQVSGTIVVETKNGKAKSVMGDLKNFMTQNNVPYNTMADGFSIDVSETAKIYARAEGNMLIISNHTIEKKNNCPVVKAIDFTNYISAGVALLNKDSKLMKDLGLDNDILLSCTTDIDKMEFTLKLKVSGSEGVLANIATMVLNAVDRGDKIESKYEEYRNQYRPNYDSFYDPYAYYDSTYVEPAMEDSTVDYY